MDTVKLETATCLIFLMKYLKQLIFFLLKAKKNGISMKDILGYKEKEEEAFSQNIFQEKQRSREKKALKKIFVKQTAVDTLEASQEVALYKEEIEDQEAFLLFNLDQLVDIYDLWKKKLPFVKPFYAVKCNTDRTLIQALLALGAGFDCASKEEIEQVLAVGASPDQIVYANPCKPPAFIQQAKRIGVRRTTFDSTAELEKIAKWMPEAELILRISVSNPTALFQLSKKYGADPSLLASQLLRQARKMGLTVVGISFHVGSMCQDPAAYYRAIAAARKLFDYGKKLGFPMTVLDIGGGFPGSEFDLFRKIAKVVRQSIEVHFSNLEVEIIAEPGRYFACSPFATVANTFHAKEVSASMITENEEDKDKIGMCYYLNDGIYGTFSCSLYDKVPIGQPLFEPEDKEKYPSTLWGPTCDCLDVVEKNKLMPRLKMGDWMYYENMGDYTTALATQFNGFKCPDPVVFVSEKNLKRIYPGQL